MLYCLVDLSAHILSVSNTASDLSQTKSQRKTDESYDELLLSGGGGAPAWTHHPPAFEQQSFILSSIQHIQNINYGK